MPVAVPNFSKTIYATIKDITEETVVEWDVDWVETGAGIGPTTNTDTLGQLAITFTRPANGGAYGTATIKAIVNGMESRELKAVVQEPATYAYYGVISAENGYDGNVGITGYYNHTIPINATSGYGGSAQDDWSEDALPAMYGVQLNGSEYLGMGTTDGEIYKRAPVGVEGSAGGVFSQGYHRMGFVLPMRAGDELWVIQQNFQGYNLPYTFTVVVGPNAQNGEVYTVNGSAAVDGSEPFTASIVRNANIGNRT